MYFLFEKWEDFPACHVSLPEGGLVPVGKTWDWYIWYMPSGRDGRRDGCFSLSLPNCFAPKIVVWKEPLKTFSRGGWETSTVVFGRVVFVFFLFQMQFLGIRINFILYFRNINPQSPKTSKDQTLHILVARKLEKWIMLNMILCLVLDFQGFHTTRFLGPLARSSQPGDSNKLQDLSKPYTSSRLMVHEGKYSIQRASGPYIAETSIRIYPNMIF